MKMMGFLSITRKFLRLSRFIAYQLRSEGPNAFARKIYRRITSIASRDPFDEMYGVDTCGEISLYELEIKSHNGILGHRYQASPADICERLFSSLPICHNDFVLIDAGCGKGRVLLVASRFSFKRLIGVEFAGELVHIARANVARFGCHADILHADVAEYQFPEDNLVIYLYNPFGPTLLRPMLTSLQRISLVHDVYVIYVNPKYGSCIQEFASEVYAIDGAKVYRLSEQRRTVSCRNGIL
jgi:predicted RNA methylase